MFILSQLSICNLHGTLVLLLSLSLNSTAGKPLLTDNSIYLMVAVQLIDKRRADKTEALGLFD